VRSGAEQALGRPDDLAERLADADRVRPDRLQPDPGPAGEPEADEDAIPAPGVRADRDEQPPVAAEPRATRGGAQVEELGRLRRGGHRRARGRRNAERCGKGPEEVRATHEALPTVAPSGAPPNSFRTLR
jgi:hypothetical protein